MAQWLKCCATNQKVAGSFPMMSMEYFIDVKNPSDRTMALGLTQPLTEMSTRRISWVERRSVHKDDNLTTILFSFSCNLETLTSWNPLSHSRPVTGLLYLYLCLVLFHPCCTVITVKGVGEKEGRNISRNTTYILIHRLWPSVLD